MAQKDSLPALQQPIDFLHPFQLRLLGRKEKKLADKLEKRGFKNARQLRDFGLSQISQIKDNTLNQLRKGLLQGKDVKINADKIKLFEYLHQSAFNLIKQNDYFEEASKTINPRKQLDTLIQEMKAQKEENFLNVVSQRYSDMLKTASKVLDAVVIKRSKAIEEYKDIQNIAQEIGVDEDVINGLEASMRKESKKMMRGESLEPKATEGEGLEEDVGFEPQKNTKTASEPASEAPDNDQTPIENLPRKGPGRPPKAPEEKYRTSRRKAPENKKSPGRPRKQPFGQVSEEGRLENVSEEPELTPEQRIVSDTVNTAIDNVIVSDTVNTAIDNVIDADNEQESE